MLQINPLNNNKKKNDNLDTPLVIWAILPPYIHPKIDSTAVIWDPFYNTGNAGLLLAKVFPPPFLIHHKNEDFFKVTDYPGDIIITNPPYSILGRIFKRLFEIDLPFVILVPSAVLNREYFKRFRNSDISIITVPFVAWGSHINKMPVPLIFICFKCGLNKQIYL